MQINYGLQDKVALVVGGTSGIGLATAKKLLQDGAEVYIASSNEEKGKKAILELQKISPRITFIQGDIKNILACENIAKEIKEKSSKLDVLVNCAGSFLENSLGNVSEAEYMEIMDINVKGTIFMTKAVLNLLTEGSSIINIASDAGLKGNYGCSVYSASKGAIISFTKSLALDLAPKTRVNCVAPGDVDTPLVTKQIELAAGSYTKEDMAQVYPLKRIGTPEEVAHVICSIASPANGFMTGSIISVDGGLTAQ